MSDLTSLERDNHSRGHDLRLVLHQVRYEQIAFWVNRVGAIFTVGFSVLFLVLLGATDGTDKISSLHNITLTSSTCPVSLPTA